MIYIVKPNGEQTEFRIGRGHDSDIRVSDISVSRYHARIKYQDNKFQLEDNTSKFGTLVMIKERVPILKNYTCAVQSGRTVVTYLLRPVEMLKQSHHHRHTKEEALKYTMNTSMAKLMKREDELQKNIVINSPEAPNLSNQASTPSINPLMPQSDRSEIPMVPEELLKREMEEDKDPNHQPDMEE